MMLCALQTAGWQPVEQQQRANPAVHFGERSRLRLWAPQVQGATGDRGPPYRAPVASVGGIACGADSTRTTATSSPSPSTPARSPPSGMKSITLP